MSVAKSKREKQRAREKEKTERRETTQRAQRDKKHKRGEGRDRARQKGDINKREWTEKYGYLEQRETEKREQSLDHPTSSRL